VNLFFFFFFPKQRGEDVTNEDLFSFLIIMEERMRKPKGILPNTWWVVARDELVLVE
jgi:hypothetical protein